MKKPYLNENDRLEIRLNTSIGETKYLRLKFMILQREVLKVYSPIFRPVIKLIYCFLNK